MICKRERYNSRSRFSASLLALLAFIGAMAGNSLEWLSYPSKLWVVTQSIF